MSEQNVDPQPESEPTAQPGAVGRLVEQDPHGFAAAFVGGMRTDGAHGRSGRTVLLGTGIVAVAALGALAFGAFGDSPGAKSNAASASPSSAGATASRAASDKGSAAPSAVSGDTGTSQPAASASPGGSTATSAAGAQPTRSAPGSGDATIGADGVANAAMASAHGGSTTTLYAGPGCSNEGANYGSYSYFTGTESNGTTDWSTQRSGGYSGNGCSGEYLSMPLNGSSTGFDDRGLWKFTFASGFTSCSVDVFVPDDTDIALVGGDPADYIVSVNGSTATAESFSIDQTGALGRWVSEAPVHPSTGEVEVHIMNTGIDYGSSDFNAHDAVAQVKLVCTGS